MFFYYQRVGVLLRLKLRKLCILFLKIGSGSDWPKSTVVGVLDEPYSAKPAQQSSHTGPPGYIGWTRFQPM